MYQIWLGLNILWEMALEHRLLVVAYLLVALVLYIYTLARRPHSWKRSFRPAVVLGVLVAILAFLVLPGQTDASFARFHQWLDWALLTAMALGVGLALAVLAWPLISLMRRQRPTQIA